MNRFVIAEPDKCIGCRTCEVACVLAHPTGAENDLTPENFRPRLRLVKGLKLTAPVQCRQCENSHCVNVCPTNALVYSANTVQLIRERCIGCQTCVLACPFGAMEIVSKPVQQTGLGPMTVRKSVKIAQKCDFCIDVPEGPQCVSVCPTHALHIVDMGALENKVDKRRDETLLKMSENSFD